MGKPGEKKAVGANNGAQGFDFDGLQEQLLELSKQENPVMAMLELINDTKKSQTEQGGTYNTEYSRDNHPLHERKQSN